MKRAQTQEQKDDRRQHILQTAATMFQKEQGEFPSVSAIARASGIAKGTVYLYFKTKEDIFLALIEAYFHDWLDKALTVIHEDESSIESVIHSFVQYLLDNPTFLQLHGYQCSIETHNSEQVLIEYKLRLAEKMRNVGSALSNKFDKDPRSVSDWLLNAFAFLNGLWNLSFPPEKVSKLLRENQLEVFLPEFELQSKQSLLLLWNQKG